MKKFFSKKPVKVIISIFIVLVLIVCICNAVFASVALDFQKGVAVFDEWSPDDVYTPDYAQSLEVGEEDYKILCLTDVHIRNHGTFASWLGINFILDGMSEIQLKKLINRVEPNLILVGGDTVLTKWNDICTQQFCDFMEKFEIPWAPVFCGFCGTDFELMQMSREGALDAKFPAGETRLILQLIREFPVTNFRLRLLKFPKMTED